MGRPATGQIPQRIFRMDDESWSQVVSAAKASGETTSEYVRRVLLRDSARVLKTQ
jgi:hypothetical protein